MAKVQHLAPEKRTVRTVAPGEEDEQDDAESNYELILVIGEGSGLVVLGAACERK